MGYFQNIHAEKGLEIFFHRNNFRGKMYPALRVKEYLYLIKRKGHKAETCFNLAMIGCEMHVKIGQKLPNSTEEP